MTKYCEDLKDCIGVPSCCSSCHEEIEQGFGDYQGPDGFCLCCQVAGWLYGHPDVQAALSASDVTQSNDR